MEYLIAMLAGTALGVIIGAVKYLILWRPLMKNKRKFSAKTITITQAISIVISVLVLLAVFFLRDLWPYSFELTLLFTALSLSLMGRLSPLKDMRKMEAIEKQAMVDDTEKKQADINDNN